MKLAVITCYFDPDYVRARSLRAAVKTLPGVKSIVVKNNHKGLLRYPEIIWKLWQVKHQQQPDAYLLTFRGQEILPFVLFLAGKKPVIFDEFIIPILNVTNEPHRRSAVKMAHRLITRLTTPLYRRWLKRCQFILADTQAHAELSARTSDMNMRSYLAVPVGVDEAVFKPAVAPTLATPDVFQVFYYGNMLPLHGLEVVLDAAVQLGTKPAIHFLIVGGKKNVQRAVRRAQKNGAQITYRDWIPFKEIPATMSASGLVLGGPFGDTQQAHHVITGKTYQALACAAPVMVGASAASEEYFVDKQNALVVPQANPEALAKAISWAQSHTGEVATVATNGRKLYDKEFSTAAIARRLQPIVAELS